MLKISAGHEGPTMLTLPAVAIQKIGIDNPRMLFFIYTLPLRPVAGLARTAGPVGQAFA
jgi:hypothetical protein